MEQKIRELIKQAMIAKKTDKTGDSAVVCQTYKNILETAQKIAKESGCGVTDADIVSAAKKEIKQATELLGFCKQSGNEEKIRNTEIAIETAKSVIPQMASEEEIRAFVEANRASFSNMGLMMNALKEKFGTALDGKVASGIVKEML